MKILVDMNLPPSWVEVLAAAGHQALHWSEVGDQRASDRTIMHWAAERGFVVFTHDLDFGAILAATGDSGPSVIQVRTQDTLPDTLAPVLIQALDAYAGPLESGALVSLDQRRARARILPLRQAP